MDGSGFNDAWQRVRQLATTFAANDARYLAPDYQEAEARKDFIDKFWIALGWDVNHDQQTNPYQQEVKVERTGANQRRADYAFYVAPNYRDVRFYVEAKKPAGDIATAANCFQTIQYGYSSRTPLAVLTDFEELLVLDCRTKPDPRTALDRIVIRYRYADYHDPEKFREVYWLFAREAVGGGSLEAFAERLRGAKSVRQPQPVDESLLAELDECRHALAHDFKTRNPRLDSAALTEITQRVLDRLVFLRFLEDKQIELKPLVATFGERGSAWRDFLAASRRLDGIYNGIVFKRHELLDDHLRVDDPAFAAICRQLDHLHSAYNFDAIPIHILGSIYERFLGKVIVATDKRVRVEEKPEVRKAGGVYYTPEYIVRYIVEHTVGQLIAGKTPDQIATMRFADIACGSGSFLLGVFDLLLTHHGHWYNANPGKAKKGDCVERDGKLYLSLRKKRDILLNNIYGVDIDAQAVEVCQLSLYLKLLKDETTASARQYLLDFEQQALLPSLAQNIVCGNSLIGTDILDDQLFATDEEHKLNPMNFADAFPHVFGHQPQMAREPIAPYGLGHEGGRRWYPGPPIYTRGFDAIVGNPPYVFGEFINQLEKEYFASHYEVGQGQYDLYHLFFERALSLIKTGGYHGYIIPDAVLARDETIRIRRLLLEKNTVRAIFHAGTVFQNVGVSAVVILSERGPSATGADRVRLHQVAENGVVTGGKELSLARFSSDPKMAFAIDASEEDVRLLEKLRQEQYRLRDWCEFSRGEELGKKHFTRQSKPRRGFVWILVGEDVQRYTLRRPSFQIRKSAVAKDARLYVAPKLVIVKTGARPSATIEYRGLVTMQSLYNGQFSSRTALRPEFFLAVVNSNLVAWYLRKTVTAYKKMFPQFNQNHFEDLPIPEPDKPQHDAIVVKVEAMQAAKEQLAKARTDKDKNYDAGKCAALDRQIDRLVYDLYRLTETEIAIVEGGTA